MKTVSSNGIVNLYVLLDDCLAKLLRNSHCFSLIKTNRALNIGRFGA